MTPLPEQPSSLAAGDSTRADQLEADMARLALIRRLRGNRTAWHRIGLELGMTGPQAKQHCKHLTAATRRAWYLQQDKAPERG